MSAELRNVAFFGVLGVFLAGSAIAAEPPADSQVPRARQRCIAFDYAVAPESLPLTQVQLWYTTDQGESWLAGVVDHDLQSPVAFEAPHDGLYGFWLIVTNALGSSRPPPVAGNTPQRWAFVDATSPVVQLHPPVLEAPRSGAKRSLALRWTALDAHLVSRPVELTYRAWPDGEWQPMAPPSANTGRLDWPVPDTLSGPIEARLRVRDRGGNMSEATSGRFDMPAPTSGAAEAPAAGSQNVEAEPISEDDRRRARRLYQQGAIHALRNERELAAARFRDAVRIDPTLTAALVDLGAVLYAQGGYDGAIDSFRRALQHDADSRAALDGLARAYVATRDYAAAREALERLLGQRPDDVRGWLSLGDLAMFQGDQVRARNCYEQAARRDPEATDVIAAARARLAEFGDEFTDEFRDRSSPGVRGARTRDVPAPASAARDPGSAEGIQR